jgi:hypothetical protein
MFKRRLFFGESMFVIPGLWERDKACWGLYAALIWVFIQVWRFKLRFKLQQGSRERLGVIFRTTRAGGSLAARIATCLRCVRCDPLWTGPANCKVRLGFSRESRLERINLCGFIILWLPGHGVLWTSSQLKCLFQRPRHLLLVSIEVHPCPPIMALSPL